MTDPLVVPPDPAWPAAFAAEARRLAPVVPVLHHIGSTAVPGLTAKPTIDILGVLPALDGIPVFALAAAGYELRGFAGLPGRVFLRRMEGRRRLAHLHLYAAGDPNVGRHLAFRGWLRARPDRAAAYGALKLELAARPGQTRAGYVEGKASWVRAEEARALGWAAQDSQRLRRR